jgi:DNA excision repair protein ERCC-4
MLLELTEHNDFFDMVVDMIPSKLYIAGQSGDDFNPRFHKMPNKESKEARRAEAKAAKRRKLDPTQTESTVQKKQRLDGTNTTKPPAPRPVILTPPASPHQSRIEALREKLHRKIAQTGGKRPPPDQVSKRAARRAIKQQRKDEQKKRASTSHVDGSDKTVYKMDANNNGGNGVAQDLEGLDFGRIAGLHKQSSGNYIESNKALKNLGKTKNIKKLLADAEKKREKLEELKKGSEDDQAKAQAMLWKDTIAEADGQRVKDDTHKLKKQLKRKEAKKKKSTKAWKARMEGAQNAMVERQSIRSHNLKMRKVGGKVGANLSKKQIADTEEDSSKRSRAGFEGRKQDFLNSGEKSGKAGKQ